MEVIIYGNDINVTWAIFGRNGSKYSLSDKVRNLWLINGPRKKEITSYSVQGRNELVFVIDNADINRLGVYKLLLQIREPDSVIEDSAYDLTQVFQVVSETYPLHFNKAVDGQCDVRFQSVLRDTYISDLEGESAYDIAVRHGFVGSEADWLDSLIGVRSVEQTTTSGVSGGVNIITFTLADGSTSEVRVRNGEAGAQGTSTLSGLYDTQVTSPVSGQYLRWNGVRWVNSSGSGYSYGAGIRIVDNIISADIQGIADGLIDAGYSLSGGGGGQSGATALRELSDVTLVSPEDGQVLAYDASTSRWVAKTVQSGGGGDIDPSVLANYVTLTGSETITGAKTFTAATVMTDTLIVGSGATTLGESATGAKKRIYFGDANHYLELNTNGFFFYGGGVYTPGFVSAGGLGTSGGGGGGGQSGATALAGLSDVNIVSPEDGQVLAYDALTSRWVAKTVQSGGGGDIDPSVLANYVTLTGSETITGAKTFTAATVMTDTLIVGSGAETLGESATEAKKRIYFGDATHYLELNTNGFFFHGGGVYTDDFMSAGGLGTSGSGGGGGATDLDGLTDVTIDSTTLSSKQVLKYTSGGWVNAQISLNDLSNVDIETSTLQDRQVLTYDSASQTWKPITLSSSTGGRGIFYGTSSSSGTARTVTATGFTSSNLTRGTVLIVQMGVSSDTNSNMTINVNSTGTKYIYSPAGYKSWKAGENVLFIYTSSRDWAMLPTYEYIIQHVSGGGGGGTVVSGVSTVVERSGDVTVTHIANALIDAGYDLSAYTLPAATSGALGGIRLGYTQSGKNYPVRLDGSNRAYVNVPWSSGSQGSTVSVAQGSIHSSESEYGTAVGTISVDGVGTILYAPKVTVTQVQTAGVEVARIKVGTANPVSIFAPSGSSGESGVQTVCGQTGDVTPAQIATALTNNGYKLTDTVPDLSNYVTTQGLNTALSSYATTQSLDSYLPLTAGNGKALTGTLYSRAITPTTSSTSQSTGYDLGGTSAWWKNTYTRRVYLADGIYVYYDETNNCIRTNAPIVSDSYISAGGVSTT